MVTTRIKKTLTAVPASIAQAITYLASIGEKQKEINRIKREAKEQIDTITAKTKQEVAAITVDRDNFFTALFAFASSRKQELTAVTRSQKTSAGTFGWRWNTPYVELAEGKTDEEVIAELRERGLKQYIRVIEELDREALLRDHPKLSGVAYMQRDEFFAKPKMKKEDGRGEELVKQETEAVDV